MSSLLPSGALPLGLGCSRLGSVGGASSTEARALLLRAWDEGVRVFDTASIYGQGDSERLLAEALRGREDATVMSKAGKYLAWHRQLMVPLKGAIRASTRRSANAKARVAGARAKQMPTRWDARFLVRSLDGSLSRLRRERIEVFFLHSPPLEVIASGDAVSALDLARQAGKIGMLGVSADDSETAMACIADARVRVLQLPIQPGATEYREVVEEAAKAGVLIVAREILGGAKGLVDRRDSQSFARARIIEMVQHPHITIPLVGATKIETLTASIDAARAGISPVQGSSDGAAVSG